MKSLVVLCLIIVGVYANVPNRKFRIANGQIAKPKQFQYQVRLDFTKINGNGQLITSLCGGALISSNTILTAAHCLENAKSVFIKLGTTKGSGEPTLTFRGASRKAGEFVVHENYNDTSIENDVALITFSWAVRFNDAISPVNLPKPDQVNLDGVMAVIAGFGKTGTNATEARELRFANRKILPSSDCQRPYKSHFQANMHVCLDGSDGIATCQGDSGGPLVIEESDGSKTVVGINSFGDVTCDTGFPTVFTRVTTYVDWIKEHMK